jgi:hypothetical protein
MGWDFWFWLVEIVSGTKSARVDSIQGGPSGSPAVASFAGFVLRTGLRRRYDRCPEEEEKKRNFVPGTNLSLPTHQISAWEQGF